MVARRPQFGPGVKERFAAAKSLDPALPIAGRAFRRMLQARIRPLLAGGAVLVYPTSPCAAPLLTASLAEQDAIREATIGVTAIAGFCGLPEVPFRRARPAVLQWVFPLLPRPAGIALCSPSRSRPPACLGCRSERLLAAHRPLMAAPNSMQIRDAAEPDIPEIQSIYAHHVLYGTGTFEEVPPSVEEMAERFRDGQGRGWAWLVAADPTGVLGFAYYTQFRDRAAYRFAAENSVYVREDVRGQGVGKALVARLIETAAASGFRQMIAVIGDSENVGSIGVHASLGFQRVGILRSVGIKFGRWLDVVLMQRVLGQGDSRPSK